MDFIDFELSGPSLFTNPFGHCLNDRMVVRSSQQQNLGLSDGNLICGEMSDQHSKQKKLVGSQSYLLEKLHFLETDWKQCTYVLRCSEKSDFHFSFIITKTFQSFSSVGM